MSPIRTHLLTALSLSSFKFLPGWAQSQECYWSNGMLANSDFKPCNQDRPVGSHSACCNLGKSPADVCLGGGLCEDEETNDVALIYAVGCTDASGEDPNCQQYCIGEFCHCRVSTQTQQRWLFLKVTAILSQRHKQPAARNGLNSRLLTINLNRASNNRICPRSLRRWKMVLQ